MEKPYKITADRRVDFVTAKTVLGRAAGKRFRAVYGDNYTIFTAQCGDQVIFSFVILLINVATGDNI